MHIDMVLRINSTNSRRHPRAASRQETSFLYCRPWLVNSDDRSSYALAKLVEDRRHVSRYADKIFSLLRIATQVKELLEDRSPDP